MKLSSILYTVITLAAVTSSVTAIPTPRGGGGGARGGGGGGGHATDDDDDWFRKRDLDDGRLFEHDIGHHHHGVSHDSYEQTEGAVV